jgi:hypothetical protein
MPCGYPRPDTPWVASAQGVFPTGRRDFRQESGMSGTQQNGAWRGMPLLAPWNLAIPDVWDFNALSAVPFIWSWASDPLPPTSELSAMLQLPEVPLPLPESMMLALLARPLPDGPMPQLTEVNSEDGSPEAMIRASFGATRPEVAIPEPASDPPAIPSPFQPSGHQTPDLLTWRILGGPDAALFLLDPASGALSFLTRPDATNPADADRDNLYEVTLEVKDVWGTTSILHRQIRVVAGSEDEPIPLPFRANETPAPIDPLGETYGPRTWDLL